jgi:hypothetical protein
MKIIRATIAMIAVGLLQANADIILAGWEGQVNAATTNASDITASLTWSEGFDASPPTDTRTGSQDETFGSVSGASASLQNSAETGAFRLPANQGDSAMTFVLTNNGTETYDLTGFHFDAYRQYPNAPSAFELAVVTDSATNIVGSGSFSNFQATVTYQTDYQDLDVDLSSYNLTLASSESITFQLVISGGLITATAQTYLDNIAVTAVPEPATLSLFLMSATGVAVFRKTAR